MERPLVVLLLHLLRALAPRRAPVAEPRSILILRIDERVGNVLLSTPLVAPLVARFPGARVTMLVARSKLSIVRGVVEAIAFEKKDSYRRPWSFVRLLWSLRRARWDVVIDASHAHQFSVTSALLLGWTAAPRRIAHDRGHAAVVATDVVPPLPPEAPEVDGKLSLLRPLGIDVRGVPMVTELGRDVPRIAAWCAGASTVAAAATPEVARLVGLVPGGRKPQHRVDVRAFVALAARARARGAVPVVLWGPGEEALAARVVEEGGAILAPPTDLEELAALMRGCAAIVANDTGPMHLAVAVGTPTIGVFAQPSGRRWGHDRPPHRVVHAAGRPLDDVVAEAVRVLDEVLDAAAEREPAGLARDASALVPESAS